MHAISRITSTEEMHELKYPEDPEFDYLADKIDTLANVIRSQRTALKRLQNSPVHSKLSFPETERSLDGLLEKVTLLEGILFAHEIAISTLLDPTTIVSPSPSPSNNLTERVSLLNKTVTRQQGAIFQLKQGVHNDLSK